MAKLEWRDSYSVGVETMDMQHKKLFAMINHLHDAMQQAKGDEAIKTVLPGLAQYTKTHFAAEEKLQKEFGFPGIAAHQELHRKLIQQVTDLMEKVNSGQKVSTVNLAVFLNDWLVNHIHGQDKQYGAFINKSKMAGAAK